MRDVSQDHFQADWKPDPQAAVFKVDRSVQSCGTTVANSAGFYTRKSGGVSRFGRLGKIRPPYEEVSSLQGYTGVL